MLGTVLYGAACTHDKQVEVEGRVGEDKLERFLHDLRNSRSRSVTLAVLTATADAPLSGEGEAFSQVTAGYASRKRAGVAHVASGLEMYFIAPAGLGQRLLRTAHDSALAGGASAALRQLLPATLDDSHMLLAVVHSKVCVCIRVHSCVVWCVCIMIVCMYIMLFSHLPCRRGSQWRPRPRPPCQRTSTTQPKTHW